MLLSESGLGALCAAGSALSWAVTGLLVRSLAPAFNSVTLNAVRSTVGGGLILVWVLATGGLAGLTAMSGKAFVLLAISVFVAVGLGDTVFFESTRDLGLARAMTVSMSYPMISALLAAVFLGERLTLRLAAGSLVALAGLVLTVTTAALDRRDVAVAVDLHVVHEAGGALAEVFHQGLLESRHAVERRQISKRGLERVLHRRAASLLRAPLSAAERSHRPRAPIQTDTMLVDGACQAAAAS